MKWSWRIGKLAGIDLRIHITFFLLIGWVAVSQWMEGSTADAMIAGVGLLLALFGCVVLHELGHALAARRYGIPTRDITLLPIGGLARLERMPEKPAHELWVAVAGPAVNVMIAAALSVWLTLTGSNAFLERLLIANLWLVGFNLIPAFPMDGGRVLRALLASRMQHVRATQIAAKIGQGLALVFGVIGLFGNPMLVLIALFVWMGAAQEAAFARMKAAIQASSNWPVGLTHLTLNRLPRRGVIRPVPYVRIVRLG